VGPGGGAASGRSERSTALTLVAIYFYIGAGFGTLGVLLVALSSAGSGSDQAILMVMSLVFAGPFIVASFIAGGRLLRREERGRSLGMVLAGLGLLFGLLYLAITGSGLYLVTVAIDCLILWVLRTTKELV
jgi:hypothetical protein